MKFMIMIYDLLKKNCDKSNNKINIHNLNISLEFLLCKMFI